MAVAVVGTPGTIVDGGTYTAESGSNRVVVAAFCAESAVDGRTISGVTLGGVAMTHAVTKHDEVAANNNNHASIWYLLEASIPAGSNALDVTWSDTMVNQGEGLMYTLSGVSQSAPLGATNSAGFQASPSATHELSVVSTDGSVGIVVDALRNAATLNSTTATWTKQLEGISSGDGVVLHKAIATGTTENVGATWSTSRDGALVSAVFAASTGSLVVTSVDSDNGIYSAQADFNVIGTGLSAGQTFKIAGIACTELSFSSSTSAKLTAPDLFANNIKLGTTVEFKAYD